MNGFHRREFLAGALGAGSLMLVPAMARADVDKRMPQALLDRAKASLDTHAGRIAHRDRIAIADFSRPSAEARFFLVDLAAGMTTSYRVAHGRGSDPAHSGWLQRFSNVDGSAASSRGAYVTGGTYEGSNGHSRRLNGLDTTNSNAYERAIVIHGAWYANDDMVARYGKLGRSEGCFAFAEPMLEEIMGQLGEGRMIYADKG